jgi:hypothetical protein
MNFGFTNSNTNSANQTVNAYQSRDGLMSTMGYKSIATVPAAEAPKREVFDVRTIQMPKMVVKNAPNHPVWSTMGGH